MLPTLSEIGVELGVYIRKINNRNHWHPEGINNIEERSKKVAAKLFNYPENVYSIWFVSSEQEFYCVVAALSADRSPKNQNIDFIYITKDELAQLGLSPNLVAEGDCLHAQSLHSNVHIDKSKAQMLCSTLMQKDREPYRWSKKKTQEILTHQTSLGCKANDDPPPRCRCENW